MIIIINFCKVFSKMTYLVPELDLLSRSLDTKVSKETVQLGTNELYKNKKHLRKCCRTRLLDFYFACAMSEFLNNQDFDKSRKCKFEITFFEDSDRSLPCLNGSP